MYPLLHILFLLRLQRQLNEDLLQLLIHKVDAKLFKSIFLDVEKAQSSDPSVSWEFLGSTGI